MIGLMAYGSVVRVQQDGSITIVTSALVDSSCHPPDWPDRPSLSVLILLEQQQLAVMKICTCCCIGVDGGRDVNV